MRKINKTYSAPASLMVFKKHHPLAQWDEIHKPENREVYGDCLHACMVDQEMLCGYTEIFLKPRITHIDHYVKRDIDPGQTFSWENMIAAVKDSRYGADWKDAKITKKDYNRTTKRYTSILNPITDSINGRFVYSTDGTIEPVDPYDVMAGKTIEVFNLNEESLKSQRKGTMLSARLMVDGGIPKDKVRVLLKESGFLSAVDYELSKK
jgi:uncharacterized protein (TIGR02646 family)